MRKIKQHTLQKLKYFEKYLNAYLLATKKLPKKYFIDAFAGTGKCIVNNSGNEVNNSGNEVDGSAMIALKAKNSFNGYLLIENKKGNIVELKSKIEKEIPTERKLAAKVLHEDCNEYLKDLYKSIYPYSGYLIFLDPEGPELFWETIRCLSKINKADLLILYPYDMSLVRLTKNFKDKLDKFYGTGDWRKIYSERKTPLDSKQGLLNFYMDNLKNIGFKHTTCRQIRTGFRNGKSLYHLILASRSPIASKIMSQIFDKELDGQRKLSI
ncbi:MAG: three-Cys-motif partner protein TcmP [bacterium]|nr:three-Cys-motif partner protein TcmP [bacterium]